VTCDRPTLVLTRRDVAQVLDVDSCIAAVEDAFRRHRGTTGAGAGARPLAFDVVGAGWNASAPAPPPTTGVLGIPVRGGGFHIKAAVLSLERPYFAAKTNANFPGNPSRHGLPTIQGVIVLADAELGTPLAILDSIEITTLRTGAATAVAAKYLARSDSHVATVCGCGVQGRAQLRALARVLPLTRVYAYDLDPARARQFAEELSPCVGVEVIPSEDLRRATRASDVCVTCTPSRRAFLGPDDVNPGCFIAAVGADNEDKQELEPALLASSAVVTDVLEQCAKIGDLHHAIAAGLMRSGDVRAELGEIVRGTKAGRTTAREIVVFDSTGTAIEDVAAAAVAYERAVSRGIGTPIALG